MRKNLAKELVLIFAVFCGGLAFFGCSKIANAQTINYGALEDVFQEPVTTSATGTPQRASEVAADMTIITADQIRQSGSRIIPEILGMYVAGLDVLQEGINQYDVGVRGYQAPYSSRLLVLIDGRQVFNDDYSRTEWDNLPINIDDIRQIEVVKGANSALFGSNATSGVVNIITSSPLYDNNKVANVQVGTQNDLQADGTYTQRFGAAGGIKISGGGLEEREYSSTATQEADFAGVGHPYHEYVDGSGAFKVTPGLTVFGEASFSQKSGDEVVPLYREFGVVGTTDSFRAGWSWNSPFGVIKNDNYFNEHDIKYAFGSEIAFNTPINDEKRNSLFVSHLEDMFEVGSDHTFRVMLEYRHKYNIDDNTNFSLYDKPVMNQNVYTVGGTWLWHIRNDISLTNAVRYDLNQTDALGGVVDASSPFAQASFQREYPAFSVNSGLVYNATDADTLRLTYGRGVQNSSLFSTGDDFNFNAAPTFAYHYYGSPDIKPTIVQSFEFGYDRQIPDIYSIVHITPFYETSHNLVAEGIPVITVDGFGNVTETQEEQNVGNSHGYGVELALDGHTPDGFRWGISYSYDYVHDSAQALLLTDFAKSAPQNQVRINLGQTLGKWEFDAHGQYMSSTSMLRQTVPTSPLGQIPTTDYFTFGGRVGYNIMDNVVASLNGTNLPSMRTVESPYTITERRLMLNLTAKF